MSSMEKKIGEARLSEAQGRAWGLFWTLHPRLYRSIDAALSRENMLPLDWYDALLSLERSPCRRLRLSELAESALLSRSGMSRMVDRLESAGLLRREECPDDRRGAFAVLTDEGREALAQAWPHYEAAIMREFAQFLSDDEARVLASLLEKIATTVPLSSIKSSKKS
jgi:DNA-binding MarR family transcriptional regulator